MSSSRDSGRVPARGHLIFENDPRILRQVAGW